MASTAPALPRVLEQYVEDAAALYTLRGDLARAAHSNLQSLMRFDVRIRAHLDGLSLSGETSWGPIQAALGRLSVGTAFVAGVRAIEGRSALQLSRLYAMAESDTLVRRGLLGAFGWVEATRLSGIVRQLLASQSDFHKFLGVAVCAIHRVEPGGIMELALRSQNPQLCGCALRCYGELGWLRATGQCAALLNTENDEISFWAARSCLLLGGYQQAAVETLLKISAAQNAFAAPALYLALQVMGQTDAHDMLRGLAGLPHSKRTLIAGSGIVGDFHYVPWLIAQMADNKDARVAAEAFNLITGVGLAASNLEARRPQAFQSGPNDDADDPNVEMDEDDGLPWPDQKLIQAWWRANSHRFRPGVRYFMGEPLNRENCLRVLKEGFQRQRIAAALYLCLLNPGTPLFDWRAPAWRQQRLLATMN